MATDAASGAHLGESEVGAYLDGSLAARDRDRVETHLAACGECRAEVREVARLLRSRAKPRRWFVLGTVAAAAVVAGVLLAPGAGVRPIASEGQRLRAGAEGIAAITTVVPADGAAIGARVVFTWHAVAPGAHYQLRVLGAAGDVVWKMDTSDTTLAVPVAVRLDRGATYFWFVDALLGDGRTATSGARRFEVAR